MLPRHPGARRHRRSTIDNHRARWFESFLLLRSSAGGRNVRPMTHTFRFATAASLSCALAGALFASTPAGLSAAGASCEDLRQMTIGGGRIDSAQIVSAGLFVPPNARNGGANPFSKLPAFCRVTATLTPSTDSDIKVEVWLPSSDWNAKLQAVGNGGWGGTIGYRPWPAPSERDTPPSEPTPATRPKGRASRSATRRSSSTTRTNRARDDGHS